MRSIAGFVRDAIDPRISSFGTKTDDDSATGRVHAGRDDEFVVFLIGMRINALWKVHRWLPIFLFGPRLVRELEDGDAGLLGSWTFLDPPRTVGFVQYWASAEALQAYAHDDDLGHTDAWREYAAQSDDRAVGIWHETYRVDGHETVYDDVGPRGLGTAEGTDLVPATGGLISAAGRLGAETDGSDTAAND